MKKNSVLFNSLYKTIFYGGSFYDGIRVGHPEEFDLDLIFTLPKNIEVLLTITNIQGFVQAQLTDFETFEKKGANNGTYRFDKMCLQIQYGRYCI